MANAQSGARSTTKRPCSLRPRAYEKVSLSSLESVGIVRFLIWLDEPDAKVIAATQAVVAWFEQVKLTGIKLVEQPNVTLPKGRDRIGAADLKAEPLWARFCEIGTNRPIFSGRDGVVKYNLAEIEPERRAGYEWYVTTPAKLLTREYPAWQKQRASAKINLDK